MKESSPKKVVSNALVDQFSRTISYLRLSLTDRCNLRCQYCMPCNNDEETDDLKIYKNIDANELLTYEELLRIVRIAVNLGMEKLRLTGGEPLIRKGVMEFISKLSILRGLSRYD